MNRMRHAVPFTFRALYVAGFFTFISIPYAANANDFSRYHTYDELTVMLKRTAESGKNIVRMQSIGTTLEKRELWMLEIANPKGVPMDERPGIFIAANFEGDHLIGSEIALYIADYFVRKYESDPAVREKIDKHVIYVMPRVNPDSAERMFAPVQTGLKTNLAPFDDDNDGRTDEDGPEDLNGDGYSTIMRVKDPGGEYYIDPDDPRLLKKANPKSGETGVYKIYYEGIDNDRDGYINEDPPGGVDINRNFMHEYPYYAMSAGRHMVSERESRALMDWIISHRNVTMILTFGESDNLITAPDDKGAIRSEKGIDLNAYAEKSIGEARAVGLFGGQAQGIISAPGDVRAPSGSGVRPLVTINAADVAYYKKISDMYRELTGIQSQPPVRRPQGAFFQYGYYQFGVLSFSTPGWGMSAPQPDSIPEKKSGAPGFGKNETKRNKTTDAIMLEWMDREKVNGFAGWQAYEHPDLGDVEIGGFKPYSLFNPPPEAIVRLGENHAAFVSHLATLFAQIKITVPEVVARGGGLFSIKAVVENTGFLPTSLAHGITSRSVKPTMVQIGVNPETILSGDDKTSFIPVLEGSGGRKEFTWLISSKPGTAVEVKAVSQKAGVDRITLILK